MPFPDLPFFFNDTATTEIYTLSLHDALPIFEERIYRFRCVEAWSLVVPWVGFPLDRKSTRLNSSHEWTSYAVFCLKKKKDELCSLVVVPSTHLNRDRL